MARPDRAALVADYGFELDTFQLDALDALDAGRHVVVAVPTGSGKTVVAEYGIAAALADGRRAFYTAPVKALSNQKYRDLVDRHGAGRVGLLTGDNAIDGDAPVVVMTTEVLRNMIYARPASLDDLALVVLDEVHFLQDAYRGPVWEEVIIHLPAHVRLVCLSATVSNAEELADWITTVRGPTSAVVHDRRPVPLEPLYLAADRATDRLRLLSTVVDGAPNPEVLRLEAAAAPPDRGRRGADVRGRPRRRLATPGRVETVGLLHERSMTPVIQFVFSRVQCDAAARACADAGMRFTTDEQRTRIREIAAERLAGFGPEDLAVLGHGEFLRRLEAGIAAHHAGMVPPFKEVVETCFIEGLLEVVFATETLAVGVNMPARTVVVEQLSKFTGERHEPLSPAQFTQLTGRAGRRGIDERGYAVVLWSPFVRFEQVYELAVSRTFHLRSAFRPTYNMAANLVRTHGDVEAHRLLSSSFAQFQVDRDVVRIERRLDRKRRRLAELEAEATSPFGDLEEYRRLQAGPRSDRGAVEAALTALRPGDVIRTERGPYRGPAAVVASSHRKERIRVTLVTPNGDDLFAGGDDFELPPVALAHVVLPPGYAPRRRDWRREVGRRVRSAKLPPRPPRRREDADDADRAHPVEQDPQLRNRLRAATQADRVRRELAVLAGGSGDRRHTLAAEFDAVLDVLSELGYVDLAHWALRPPGEMLSRTFHECDLLVVECLRRGLFDGLDAATLAGVASVFVYEHRRPDDPPAPWFPDDAIAARWGAIAATSEELHRLERSRGLREHRAPDPGFPAAAHGWVAGEGFATVLDEDLTGGDFVRTMKQLLDLLRQLAQVAPAADTRRVAREAYDRAFRDVIADSSLLSGG